MANRPKQGLPVVAVIAIAAITTVLAFIVSQNLPSTVDITANEAVVLPPDGG